jgi:hypothetical protein
MHDADREYLQTVARVAVSPAGRAAGGRVAKRALRPPCLLALCLLVGFGCAAVKGEFRLESHELVARDGLRCDGYVVWENEPITDIVLSMSGSGTGSSAFLPDVAAGMVRSRTAAFITFDKPGVHATFGEPSSVHIDDAPFAAHTQGTLLDCAQEALLFSVLRFGPAVRWHFSGHSEGAIIELFLLDKLIAERPEDARRVDTLILSGLPLEPFADNLERQLADKPVLQGAVASCDWAFMREQMGVSCAYLADAASRPSGFAMFARLALARSVARFRGFQGNDDFNTPASFMFQLEAWNTTTGHLDLAVRYYDGAHAGTPEVRQEMADLLLGLAPAADGWPVGEGGPSRPPTMIAGLGPCAPASNVGRPCAVASRGRRVACLLQ